MIYVKYEDKIFIAKKMIDSFSIDFIQNGRPYIIQNGYEHISELIVLFGKQTNLFESILVLLENNHNEEALILNRSLINNAFLIHFLHHKNQDVRFKEYKIQPFKSNLKRMKKYKKMLENGYFDQVSFQPFNMEEVNEKIDELEALLINEGFATRNGNANTELLTVSRMADEDQLLYVIYAHYYDLGSKYEHSDSSSLEIYKQPFEEMDTSTVFIMDLSKTNIELGEEILTSTLEIYILTFLRLVQYIEEKYSHLFEELLRNNLGRSILLAQEYNLFLENQVISDYSQ